MNWDHEKKYKFGVITRPSTYLGCNNITTFFSFFLTPSLNENKRSLHFKNLKTELKNHFAWEVLFKDKAWTLYGIEVL